MNKEPILLLFGNNVQKYRKAQKLSQERLAELAGVHRTYIGMIERAEKNITLCNIAKIAKALNIDITYLLNAKNMPKREIQKFPDGSILEIGTGKFDDYCVFLTRPNQTRQSPRDVEYFNRLRLYAQKYGNRKIYDDFISIYNRVSNNVDQNVLDDILLIGQSYPDDSIDISIDYTILYLGMIAEELKENSILGKRIKRLGVHQVLIDGELPEIAANFSKKTTWKNSPVLLKRWQAMGENVKFWQVLDSICKSKGF